MTASTYLTIKKVNVKLFTKLATAIVFLPLLADAQLVIAPAGKENSLRRRDPPVS